MIYLLNCFECPSAFEPKASSWQMWWKEVNLLWWVFMVQMSKRLWNWASWEKMWMQSHVHGPTRSGFVSLSSYNSFFENYSKDTQVQWCYPLISVNETVCNMTHYFTCGLDALRKFFTLELLIHSYSVIYICDKANLFWARHSRSTYSLNWNRKQWNCPWRKWLWIKMRRTMSPHHLRTSSVQCCSVIAQHWKYFENKLWKSANKIQGNALT